MNLFLLTLGLAQSNPPVVEATVADEPEPVSEPVAASRWSAPHDGFRLGLGPEGTLNFMPHGDLAGISVGVHFDLSFKKGRFEGRLAPTLTAFGGWNGHDGFGYLLTAAVEVSMRFYYWRFLAVGAGAMPAVSAGSFQNCTVSIYAGELGGGGSFCTPLVKPLYVSVAPVLYPIIATLGSDAQNEIGLQLSWPIAVSGGWTFPSVMIHYSHAF